MTLRLTVDTTAWRAHVEHLAASFDPLVPVVKGNGYGFGRSVLARIADDLLAKQATRTGDAGDAGDAPTIAVGTVFELGGLPARLRPVVLTPPSAGAPGTRPLVDRLSSTAIAPIVTVAAPSHVGALSGWRGSVLVKLASSMRRFGVTARELDDFERRLRPAGLDVAGYSIHLPLDGDETELVAEVERWLTALERRAKASGTRPMLSLSHLSPAAYDGLRIRWENWTFPMRLGTALWHGDKAALHLGADVIDSHTVAAGTTAGYRGTRVNTDGTLLVIGAGTAHGVTALEDGRSPFHFRRRRLALLERPHMHASMVFVPTGAPCPAVGDVVDVQRPLTSVSADEVIWRDL